MSSRIAPEEMEDSTNILESGKQSIFKSGGKTFRLDDTSLSMWDSGWRELDMLVRLVKDPEEVIEVARKFARGAPIIFKKFSQSKFDEESHYNEWFTIRKSRFKLETHASTAGTYEIKDMISCRIHMWDHGWRFVADIDIKPKAKMCNEQTMTKDCSEVKGFADKFAP